MSSFKSILGNHQKINIESLHIRNQLQFNEDNYSIHHTLNPDNGRYEITNNATGAKLLGFNHDSTLRSDSAVYRHVADRVNPVVTVVTSHTTSIADHEDRVRNLEPVIVTGTSSNNTPFVVATIAVPTNKMLRVYGTAITKQSSINFDVLVKNSAGTVSIVNYFNDCHITAGEDITYSINGTNLRISLTNSNSSTAYKLSYLSDSMSL